MTIEKRKAMTMDWFKSIESNTEKKVLTGQFIGWGSDTYFEDIGIIHQMSGKWLGHLGLDYHTMVPGHDPALKIEKDIPNKIIIDYGVKICNLSMHFNNPFTDSSSWSRFADLSLLFQEGNLYIAKLNAELDSMALGMKKLQEAGILVLYRPLHEMSGDWFWWCKTDTANFRKLWIHIYKYLTVEKELKNIIWAYSPSTAGDALLLYPGDDYVDVVCFDAYTPNLYPDVQKCYDQLCTLNKPIEIREYGCLDGSDVYNKNNYRHDFMKFVNDLKTHYPKICFFLTWRKGFSLKNHLNIDSMLNDPVMINKNDLPNFLK